MLSEVADFVYKTSTYYDPELESGFAYDDPEVAIAWPTEFELIASARNREAPKAPRPAEKGALAAVRVLS